MGSRYAIDRLVHACKQHKDSHNIWFSAESRFSRFAFANGEEPTVRERLIIYLRNRTSTTGWITRSVDILDKGRVPILFPVEQMRNLRMNIEHTPVGEFLTCPMFGMKKTPLAVSASSQPILDIMSLATAKEKLQHSFLSHALACPACEGKHRPHTYKDDCKKAKPKTAESTPPKSKKKSEPKESPKTTVKAKPKGKKVTKADEPIGIFEKAKEPVPGLRPLGEVPPVRSGPASGSREPAPPDGEEERPDGFYGFHDLYGLYGFYGFHGFHCSHGFFLCFPWFPRFLWFPWFLGFLWFLWFVCFPWFPWFPLFAWFFYAFHGFHGFYGLHGF